MNDMALGFVATTGLHENDFQVEKKIEKLNVLITTKKKIIHKTLNELTLMIVLATYVLITITKHSA